MADFPFGGTAGETPETLRRRRAREAIILGQRMPQSRGQAGLPSSFLTLTDRHERASGGDRLSGHAERDGAVAPTDITATNPDSPFNADTAAQRGMAMPARAVIARGANRAAVVQWLRQNNINPEGL